MLCFLNAFRLMVRILGIAFSSWYRVIIVAKYSGILGVNQSSDLPLALGVKAHSTRMWRPPRPFWQGLYAGHLQHCGMVHAPNIPEVLWPWYMSHSGLFCSLVLAVLFHTRQGFASLAVWASRSHSISTQLEFLKGNVSRLHM